MDASQVLTEAWKAVQASGVPEQLHETAFKEAVALLSDSDSVQKPPPLRQPLDAKKTSKDGTTPIRKDSKTQLNDANKADPDEVPRDSPTESEFYERLANETHADRETIEDVVSYSPTKPVINATGRQLGSTQRQKQVAIAVVLSVAYQVGLGESIISVSTVRDVCEGFRCADRNLSQVIRETKGLRLTGDKRTKDIQIRDAALDLFKLEVERIVGASSDSGE